MGAWIEIEEESERDNYDNVAPFMGAWIEILMGFDQINKVSVAPFMGAWIEMFTVDLKAGVNMRRSLHGSVD